MLTFPPLARARSVLPLALLFAPTACDRKGSVDDLWLRDDAPIAAPADPAPVTKTVQARVNVRLASNAQAMASTDASAQSFALRCYALDANGAQVALVGADGVPAQVLPVTLNGATTSFNVAVQLPSSVVPGPAGYNLHFALARPSAPDGTEASAVQRAALPHASRVSVSASTKLDAVCGNVAANTPATDNPVDLSIAASLAYAIVSATGQHLDPQAFVTAHANLATVLLSEQTDLESEVDAKSPHSLDDYINALSAALQDAVVQQPALQAATAQTLASVIAKVSQNPAASQAFASSFSSQVAQMGANAAVAFNGGANADALRGVFNQAAAAARATSSAAPVMGTSALSPRGVTFTDTDIQATLGGTVGIVPPVVQAGVTGYRVYLGDASRTLTALYPIGEVVAGPSPTLNVPAGTPVPPGATTVWAEAVSNATSLGFVGTPLVNVNAYLQRLRATAGDGSVSLTWDPVPNADHYTIYRSSTGAAGRSGALATTKDAAYVDATAANGTAYSYAISYALGGSGAQEGALSQQVSARPVKAPYVGPGMVQGVKARASVEDVLLTWAPVPQAVRYAVYRTKLQSGESQALLYDHAGGGFLDPAVSYGSDYAYTVAAIDGNDVVGPQSASVEASLALEPPPLDCSGGDSCTFERPAQASYVEVFRGVTLPLGTSAAVLTTTDTHFTTARPSSGAVYYAVRAVDSNGVRSVLSLPEGVTAAGSYPVSGSPALVVWGQPNDVGAAQGSSGVTLASAPVGVTVDAFDSLLFSEPNANRVHGFSRVRTVNGGESAWFLTGQGSPEGTSPGNSFAGLSRPLGVSSGYAYTGATVLIADSNNARMVGYDNSSPLHWQQPASMYLGGVVGDGGSGVGANGVASASGLLGVTGAVARKGIFLVVDAAANRVLLYQDGPSGPSQTAHIVLGQHDFTSTAPNPDGVNACSLFNPTSAWTDGNQIIVYDAGNARVLIWSQIPVSNYKAADVVIGQPTMTSASPNGGSDGVSTHGFAGQSFGELPAGLSSNGDALAVADPGNNRVLLYNEIPTANNVVPDVVLGQSGLLSGGTGSGSTGLNQPTGVAWYGYTHLVVSDSGNKRVVMY